MLTRREFIKLTGGIGSALLGEHLFSLPGKNIPPNIIIFMTDDLGYADIGVHGCTDIPTPGIDTIAREGVLFRNGYVSSPICSPSRAGLLTGRYQQRFGYEFNTGKPPHSLRPQVGIPREELTLGEALKNRGYMTGIIGKWHLGALNKFHPLNNGFDYFYGFLEGDHKYLKEEKGPGRIYRGFDPVREDAYLTEAFTRESLNFIKLAGNRPFFLYLPFNAAHTPLQAPRKYLEQFSHIRGKKRKIYAAMVSALDDGIRTILSDLDSRGRGDNTLVFFLNDNGGHSRNNGSSNLPFRGGKGSLREGGIHVPFLMRWRSVIRPGQISGDVVSSLDIFPTSLAASGGAAGKGGPVDGVNLVPYITGKKKGPLRRALFWRSGRRLQNFAVRDGKWKLLRYGRNRVELYDLSSDISERENLRSRFPAVVKKLEKKLIQWNGTLRKPLWRNPRPKWRKKD